MDQPDPGHVVGQFPETLFGKVPAGIEIVRNDRIQRDLLFGQIGGCLLYTSTHDRIGNAQYFQEGLGIDIGIDLTAHLLILFTIKRTQYFYS